jgi:transcriptional regulator with XRE-family HTH domain
MGDFLHRKFAKRLRQLRLDRGLTQERLAERADLSADSVRRLEAAGFSPTLRVLDQLSRALEVPLPDLVRLSDLKQPEKVLRLVSLLTSRKEQELELVLRLAQAALFEQDDDLRRRG